eukprot:3246435-Pyramimonas_sp.AAC.1
MVPIRHDAMQWVHLRAHFYKHEAQKAEDVTSREDGVGNAVRLGKKQRCSDAASASSAVDLGES